MTFFSINTTDRHQIGKPVLTSDSAASRLCEECKQTEDRLRERRIVTGPGACAVKAFADFS